MLKALGAATITRLDEFFPTRSVRSTRSFSLEQGLAGSTALPPDVAPPHRRSPTTGTTGTATSTGATSTVGTSSTSPAAFADALAQAQASTESSAATGVLDPSDPSDLTRRSPIRPSALDSSDLLGGGDSQLLSALQSATATTHADRDNRRDPRPTVDRQQRLRTGRGRRDKRSRPAHRGDDGRGQRPGGQALRVRRRARRLGSVEGL